MDRSRSNLTPLIATAAVIVVGALAFRALQRPVGNRHVPQPVQPVDLNRYLGLWYEIGRYENGFERGTEGVTAEYRRREDGLIEVINRARQGGVDGREKVSIGRAKVVRGSDGAKLKVSFFGPFFFGDYWVLDHADDYSWAIVGEPSGRYLWLLSRTPHLWERVTDALEDRARELGYDTKMLRPTAH